MNFVKLKEKQDFINLLILIDKEIQNIEDDATRKDKYSSWYQEMITVKVTASNVKRNI